MGFYLRFFSLAVVAIVLAAAGAAVAGPGHDHGPSEPILIAPASPRLVAVSETYELVAILKEGALNVYLDRMADTLPVADAKVEMVIDGETHTAAPQADGTYKIVSQVLRKPGLHEVIVTIAEAGQSDLLLGTLTVPDPGHDHFDHDHADHHRGDAKGDGEGSDLMNRTPEAIAQKLQSSPLLAGLALAVGVMAGALVRGRTGLMIGLVGLVAVLGAGVAWAGPGHDHGEGGVTAVPGDGPRRLSDGVVFLPKPTQRLLAIRTLVLDQETAREADRLIGRVIVDPNRSGLVQSTIGGRVRALDTGLPTLGQGVKKGDVIAYVEPAFAPIDASDVRQTAGDLAQRIAVLDARIARQEGLVRKNISSRANLEDLEIERTGLIARREELTNARNHAEALVAPVDGVIADVQIVAGQVVSAGQTLMNIVDPGSLWVEAISFDPRIMPSGNMARARTSAGEIFELTFVGRSRALQQQATVLQFKLKAPTDALNIGSPVKVLIEKGAATTGLVVPRSALAQAPNGQLVAFRRLEPERYLPTAVRVQDLDGTRVRITAGLKAGDQIIVVGAPLVNQIR